MAFKGNTDVDNSFGPAVEGVRDNFDFTVLFEDSFFTIAPASLLLIAIPLRTLWLWTKTSLPAAAVDFAAASALCVLSYLEHSRSVRPSFIINLYLLLSIPLDVARTRTLWLLPGRRSIALVLTMSTIVKAGVLVLEANSKREILTDRYRDLPPEATSGIYSRSTFWWMNPLLKTGFFKTLFLKDLYALDPEIQSRDLLIKFQQAWDRTNKQKSHCLFNVCAYTLMWPFIASAIPRLILIGFRYSQPFLLHRTVGYVQEQASKETSNIGWGLVGAYAIVYVGLAVFAAAYEHLTNRLVTMLRGGLIAMIYAKTIEISITSLDESASMTLMSADVERIAQSFLLIQDAWGTMVEVGIAVYLLERQLGLACVGPAAIAIASTIATFVIAKAMGSAQKLWLEAIQSRINVTAHNLGAMRSIKLLGLASHVSSMIQGFRVNEVELSTSFRRINSGRILIGNLTQILAPVLTFGIFIGLSHRNGQILTTATAFTAFSVLALVSSPMQQLSYIVPQVVSSIACFDRIQKFLHCPSRTDHRLSMAPMERERISSHHPAHDRSTSDIELQDLAGASKMLIEEALVVQDGSFGWSQENAPVLHDITLRIKASDFVIVAGPIGSGKSTLMKGLLGETPTAKGFVYTSSHQAAFAGQDAWIQNTSIKSNIVGLANFDQGWYDAVLVGCALDKDLEHLANRDATMVGSKGISLSGGQKQRLSMARAIYQKSDLIIFDDVFSGLDADTEDKIFDRLFSRGGLLRRLPTTVILVSHGAHRLPYADHIIALSSDGTIAEQGSWDQLRFSGGYIQGISKGSKELTNKRVESSAPKQSAIIAVADNDMNNTAADLSRKTGDWLVYKYWLSSLGVSSVVIIIITLAVLIFLWKFPEFWVKLWTASVARNGNKVNEFYMSIFTALAVASMVTLIGLYANSPSAPLHFLTKFSNDISLVDIELPNSFIECALSIFMAIGTGILMSFSAGYFAAVLPLVIFILYIIQRFYLRTSRQIRLLELEARAPLYTHFQESLNGLTTIRAFGWSEKFQEQNMFLLDESQQPFYLLLCIQRWLQVVLDLIVAALAVIMVILIVTLRTKLDAGYVGLGLLNIMSFNTTLADAIKNWTKLETSIGAIARIRSFIMTTESEMNVNENLEPPKDWPSKGLVEIRNFAASYDAESRLVLTNVNLDIAAGNKVGICGRSGSGKSSLLASLLHLLEYRDGLISIDGIDLSFVPRDLLRQKLNVISQEPYFLMGSVRMNAMPWASKNMEIDVHSRSDEEIIAALKRVELWPVIEQKGGLDTQMNSDFLSHGQRQLFCLARALLRKSKIVILDEVTSSVDIHTDALMQKIIRSSFADCTIIAVAHRLKTIVDFDKVVVLGAGGRVLESGDPQRLLATDGSAFRELYET
ncbi:MAG: hypothetical protein Q9160_001961 [Pyrenula sp. 1 TL-2023]